MAAAMLSFVQFEKFDRIGQSQRGNQLEEMDHQI